MQQTWSSEADSIMSQHWLTYCGRHLSWNAPASSLLDEHGNQATPIRARTRGRGGGKRGIAETGARPEDPQDPNGIDEAWFQIFQKRINLMQGAQWATAANGTRGTTNGSTVSVDLARADGRWLATMRAADGILLKVWMPDGYEWAKRPGTPIKLHRVLKHGGAG